VDVISLDESKNHISYPGVCVADQSRQGYSYRHPTPVRPLGTSNGRSSRRLRN
jgi:hypothetical protein